MLLYTHPACLAHEPGPGHPESPSRLQAVLEALYADRFAALDTVHAPRATREQLIRTHDSAMIDVIFDNAGNRSWKAMRRVLAEGGVVVLVGGPRSKRLLGPLGHVARVKAASLFGGGRAVFFIAKPNNDDLATLRELIESGRVRPVLQQTVPLEQVADALALMRDGHARAKVAIAIDDDATVSAASGRS